MIQNLCEKLHPIEEFVKMQTIFCRKVRKNFAFFILASMKSLLAKTWSYITLLKNDNSCCPNYAMICPLQLDVLSYKILRDCCIKFATGINMIIDIAQKVYKWSGCSFAKMVLSWDNHFGKRTTWLLIDILNYAFWYIYPSRKFDATVSMY